MPLHKTIGATAVRCCVDPRCLDRRSRPVSSPLLAADTDASSTPAPFDFAVYATGTGCGAITISGNAYTDSFDSSQGNYSQTEQLSHASIGATGNTTLNGSVTVNGSISSLNPTVGDCLNGTPGITVSTLTFNSASSATAVLNIDPAAATGARNVTLTTGSEVVTLANGFAVTAGTPVISQVNPNTGQQRADERIGEPGSPDTEVRRRRAASAGRAPGCHPGSRTATAESLIRSQASAKS
jgi:hypothetical protein